MSEEAGNREGTPGPRDSRASGDRPGCPVAAVGASAGGLAAFTRLLRALPARIGMALVLIQHLDPTQESMLADILGRESKMPVTEAVDGMRAEPDHVYVMPANVTMRISDSTLRLEERPKPPTQVLPIDTFLRSLADGCAELSIGVVLSGTGTDGVLGLQAVRSAGGLTFAQDPETAEYDGMPRAATDAGVVDAVLAPERIAEELVRLGRASDLRGPEAQKPVEGDVDEQAFVKILSLVREATGLDLSHYRRSTLLRRVSRRMLLEGVGTMGDYLHLLQEHPAAVEAIYRDVLVNMTEFFRDPDALDALGREVFPRLLEHREAEKPIRIWVPGCSKGQEAYSILISLVEFLDDKPSSPPIQMFATDVNERDIEFARAGVYPQGIAHEVSPERLARFFVQLPQGYQIDRAIRDMCVFATHDVTKDPPFSKLDLVSFRNVLIYMDRPLQQRVLQILHYALEPGRFLLLGSSETVGLESALFSVVDKKHRIYKRKRGPARLLPALAPSAGAIGLAHRGPEDGQPAVFDVLQEAEKVVQGAYQPSGILVNADLEVLQFRGHVAPFLDPAEGPPDVRLTRLVATGLSSAVQAAIREAAKTSATARRRGVMSERDGLKREVEVEVVPIPGPAGESYYLVLFTERPTETAPGTRIRSGGEKKQGLAGGEVEQLRRELDETREQLAAVSSEREAADSDLRAATERFQSRNEELRTINEEFQTAQEELQSTNEELTTLNDELRNRNTELGRLNDDLNNVIEGVELPILILDADLRIRRVTPEAEAIVSVLPSDAGRPITDFKFKVDVPDLKEKVHDVLERRSRSETEVRRADGRWYSMRIRPYQTGEGEVDGVVIAFVDIDELKRITQAAEAARDHAEAVVETVREPLLTLGMDQTIREANQAFYKDFAVGAEDTLGRRLCELGNGRWDFPELRAMLDGIPDGDHDAANLVVDRDFPGLGQRVMMLSARRVREEGGEPSILLAIDDITSLAHRERLSAALNNIGVAIGSSLEFDQILAQVLEDSTEAMGAESSEVLLRQDATWVMKSVFGMPAALMGRVLAEEEVPFALRSPQSSEPVLLDESSQKEIVASRLGVEPEPRSTLVVPLFLREVLLGTLSFHYATEDLTLTDAEDDFARRLGTLLSVAFENAQLYETQREIANTLQSALLTVPRRIPRVEFGYLYRSATTSASVGGDFYDLFELDGGRAAVLIGDVSGKGVQAATLTALVKNTTRAFAYENDSPAAVVAKTSAVIYKATPSSMFVTLMFCVIDTATGHLVYCSAGHARSIVKRRGGEIELLDVASPLTGAFDSAEFENGETTLERGDVLVLYTDGVTEARRDGELFGEEGLVEFIRSMLPTSPKQVPEAVFDEVLRFTGGTLSDDVAIVAVARGDGG